MEMPEGWKQRIANIEIDFNDSHDSSERYDLLKYKEALFLIKEMAEVLEAVPHELHQRILALINLIRKKDEALKWGNDYIQKNGNFPMGDPIPCPDNKPGCLVAHYIGNPISLALALTEKLE